MVPGPPNSLSFTFPAVRWGKPMSVGGCENQTQLCAQSAWHKLPSLSPMSPCPAEPHPGPGTAQGPPLQPSHEEERKDQGQEIIRFILELRQAPACLPSKKNSPSLLIQRRKQAIVTMLGGHCWTPGRQAGRRVAPS